MKKDDKFIEEFTDKFSKLFVECFYIKFQNNKCNYDKDKILIILIKKIIKEFNK